VGMEGDGRKGDGKRVGGIFLAAAAWLRCVCAYVYLSRDSVVRVFVYTYLSREGGQICPLSFLFWD
jgi:hypothetical protein